MSCFRTQMSAAPLKLIEVDPVTLRLAGFRTQMSAAPLKPDHLGGQPPLPVCFRTQMSAAPLKHSKQPATYLLAQVSALR